MRSMLERPTLALFLLLVAVILAIAVVPAWRRRVGARWAGLRLWVSEHEAMVVLGSLSAAFLLIFFWGKIVISIYPGEGGVLWRRFSGMVIDSAFEEGVHFVLPWDRMYIYDTRIQKLDTTVKAVTQSGLEVSLDITIRWNPVHKLLARLHREIGPDYVKVVVVPEVVSALRAEVGQWEPSSLYEQNVDSSTNTQEIQLRTLRASGLRARRRYITIEDVLILSVTLPRPVMAAVERKFEQQQARDEYAFRVQRERLEADRKEIEAIGIQRFQAAISKGLEEKYLQWRGIEATLELAKSPNSKVIVIGSGSNGLPLILNPDGPVTPPKQDK